LPISFRPPISIKLPSRSNVANLIQVQVGYHNFIFVSRTLNNDLATRVAEVTLAIKLTDIPRFFDSHSIDCSHEVPVGHGMGRLL